MLRNLITPALFHISKFHAEKKAEVLNKEVVSMLVHYALEGSQEFSNGNSRGDKDRSGSNASASSSSSSRSTVSGLRVGCLRQCYWLVFRIGFLC